jgi:hypothetical protein
MGQNAGSPDRLCSQREMSGSESAAHANVARGFHDASAQNRAATAFDRLDPAGYQA